MNIKFGLISFLILAAVLFGIVNTSLVLQAYDAPPTTFFTFVHTVEVDYFLYLAVIKAGMYGLWTTPAVYTSEVTQNSLMYLFLILVGKIASITHVSPIAAYHITRIISVSLMFVGIFKVGETFLGKRWAFWGSLVGLLSTVPPFMLDRSLFPTDAPTAWWNVFDPVARLDYLPHHAFGLAALFIAVYFFFKKYIGISSFFSFIAGIVFPPAGLVIVFGFPLAGVFYQLKMSIHRQQTDKKLMISLIPIVLSSLLALLILAGETQKGFPWSQWKDWDKAMWNSVPNFNRDFILSGGLVLLVSLPTIGRVLGYSSTFPLMFLSIWALLPYMLLPFTDTLGIGKIRMAFTGSFLPLGLLAVTTVQRCGVLISNTGSRRAFYISLFFLFLLLSLPVSFRLNNERFSQKKYLTNDYPHNKYVPANMLDSMMFLDQHIEPYKVVLADFTIGNMLPAFAPAKTYLGSWTQTKDYVQKNEAMYQFYSGTMTKRQAHEFIEKGRIDYIYVGIFEKIIGADISKYQLPLSEIYNKDGITIYKVERLGL